MRSDLLFAMPSWLSGAARTFDVFGQFDEYNDIRDEESADAVALYSDWRAVGESLVDVIRVFQREPGSAHSPDSE